MKPVEKYFKFKLSTDRKWMERGLIILFDQQTTDEQTRRFTDNSNGVGFNKPDAKLLSSFAQQIKDGKTLSSNQLIYLQRKLPKYWRQLYNVSDKNKIANLQIA